jgi:hypothetical protein
MICEKNVKIYCSEDISKIENYFEAVNDIENTWDCHHRFETHNSDGYRWVIDISRKELIALGMYYNKPSTELIFIKRKDHLSLHCKDRKIGNLTEEHKQKIARAHKGKKRIAFSEEWKSKLSKANKGKNSPNRKPVLCLETNEIFASATEAAEAKSCSRNGISRVCLGQNKTAGGYHWQFK